MFWFGGDGDEVCFLAFVGLFFKLYPLRMSPYISQCHNQETALASSTEKHMWLFLLKPLAFPKSSTLRNHFSPEPRNSQISEGETVGKMRNSGPQGWLSVFQEFKNYWEVPLGFGRFFSPSSKEGKSYLVPASIFTCLLSYPQPQTMYISLSTERAVPQKHLSQERQTMV